MPANRNRTNRRHKRGKSGSDGVRWRRLLLRLTLVGLVLGLVGTAWLDAFVRHRFANHQWHVPARVYARPVELYAGRQLTRAHLDRLLDLMRYRRQSGAPRPGTWSTEGDSVLLHTRGFQDTDGGEPERLLRLTLENGHIQRLGDGAGHKVDVARLEPLQIGSIHPGENTDRVMVRLQDVPKPFIQILLSVEDRRFYQHHGVSFRGMARAALADLRAGGITQGGSTLTQQLVKNFWLTSERSFLRKLVEIPMALLLELHYSKDQILEAYLNEVYLGQDGSRSIRGMGLGARFYFGQPLKDLEPDQFALLVGLLKGPSWYDPRRNPQRALHRRDTVLQEAYENGALTLAEYQKYRSRPLGVVKKGQTALYAFPAFIDLVRRQLSRDYPEKVLATEGLKIHSTLDVLDQLAAESSLEDFFKKHPSAPDSMNGAVVMTDPQQGDVLALVSNKQPRDAGFNRALDAVRPIGSLVKPAIVLTAIRHTDKYSLATRVVDGPIEVTMPNGNVWKPHNFDDKSLGPIPLLTALTDSRNQAMARLGLDLGLPPVIDTLHQLGVKRDIPRYPSILLGSLEMTPFEVSGLYQTFANGGFRTPLRSITDVFDNKGNLLARYPVTTHQVVDSGPAFVLQWAMQQVVKDGTGSYAGKMLPQLHLAGKTGTSDGFRDSWFAGFSGSRMAVVWIGRDDNGDTGLTGNAGALRVWTDLMERVPERPLQLRKPDSVQWTWMDADGERVSGPACPDAHRYPMLTDSVPDATTTCGKAGQVKRGIFKWFRGLFD